MLKYYQTALFNLEMMTRSIGRQGGKEDEVQDEAVAVVASPEDPEEGVEEDTASFKQCIQS